LSPDQGTLIEAVLNGCQDCGIADEEIPQVEIVQIRAGETGWQTVGTITSTGRFCDSCGAFYVELRNRIPVEIAEYPCPKCDKSDLLEYRIERIERTDDGYAFAASVQCKGCNRRSLFRRLLDQLNRVTKIKVGVDGVELERSGG
jgi:hypothetical protein